MADGVLLAEVERQVGKARAYGFDIERDLAVYVVAAYLLGEEFDCEMPAARSVLAQGDLSGREKADWLEAWTTRLFETLEEDQPEGGRG